MPGGGTETKSHICKCTKRRVSWSFKVVLLPKEGTTSEMPFVVQNGNY